MRRTERRAGYHTKSDLAREEDHSGRKAGFAAVVPREDTGAQSQHGNDALRRERAARSAKATAPGDAMPRLALRPDGPSSVLDKRP